MFFLLRMGFWLTVVCVLLPGSGDSSKTPEANIDPVQAVTLASAAVSDVRGFCERQPDACVVGGKVATAIGHKAEAGARTIIEFVSTQFAEKPAAEKPDGAQPARLINAATTGTSTTGAIGQPSSRGTLTASDMRPAWQAPVPLPPRREARAGRPAA